MQKHLKKTFAALALLCAMWGTLAITAAEDEDAAFRARVAEVRAAQTPIEFYGKVVDLDGNPIEGATIALEATTAVVWPKGNPYLKGAVTTNQDGLFEVNAAVFGRKELKGTALGLESFTKDGYEFDFNKSPDDWYQFRSDLTSCHKPDKAKPIVFYMRKRGELTFVLDYTTFRPHRKSAGTEEPKILWVDLVSNKIVDEKNRLDWESKKNPHWDMQIIIERDPESNAWNLTYKTFDDNSGVFVSKQKLYTAPGVGYEREISLQVPVAEKQEYSNLCVAVKSREPVIYSLVNSEQLIVSEKTCKCIIDFQINPYGERNFEYKRDEIPWRLDERLKKEAEEALSEGRLPEKPDLPKLIEEYRNKEDD